jgi:methyl-accepting chemotaxis protein
MWLIIGQAVSKPITTLVQGARRIALGDSAVTGVNRQAVEKILVRSDEIGAIGKAFTEITGYQKEMAEMQEGLLRVDLTARVTPKDEKTCLGMLCHHG